MGNATKGGWRRSPWCRHVGADLQPWHQTQATLLGKKSVRESGPPREDGTIFGMKESLIFRQVKTKKNLKMVKDGVNSGMEENTKSLEFHNRLIRKNSQTKNEDINPRVEETVIFPKSRHRAFQEIF
ncbi:hypothetical protein U1Q18_038808 [Sarracenia purpurea var. burkii]